MNLNPTKVRGPTAYKQKYWQSPECFVDIRNPVFQKKEYITTATKIIIIIIKYFSKVITDETVIFNLLDLFYTYSSLPKTHSNVRFF